MTNLPLPRELEIRWARDCALHVFYIWRRYQRERGEWDPATDPVRTAIRVACRGDSAAAYSAAYSAYAAYSAADAADASDSAYSAADAAAYAAFAADPAAYAAAYAASHASDADAAYAADSAADAAYSAAADADTAADARKRECDWQQRRRRYYAERRHSYVARLEWLAEDPTRCESEAEAVALDAWMDTTRGGRDCALAIMREAASKSA